MKKRTVILSIGLLLALAALCTCDRPRTRPTLEPGAVLLSYERTGGIAGFQDRLVIGADGEYYFDSQGHPERIGTLSAERRTQLQSWLENWSAFTLTLEDNPGGPDNMKREVIWNGAGKTTPTQAEQREVLQWVSALLDELSAVNR